MAENTFEETQALALEEDTKKDDELWKKIKPLIKKFK